jgi:hypothetical protein
LKEEAVLSLCGLPKLTYEKRRKREKEKKTEKEAKLYVKVIGWLAKTLRTWPSKSVSSLGVCIVLNKKNQSIFNTTQFVV